MTEHPDFPAALEQALRLLAQSPRSEQQIRSSLRAKPFEEEVVEAVVARLLARHMLDDAELAQSRAQSRQARGFGREKILGELERLGIDPSSVALVDEPQWTETTLRRRLEKRPEMTRAQAYRFLASRGFPEEHVQQAVDSVFGAEDRFTE